MSDIIDRFDYYLLFIDLETTTSSPFTGWVHEIGAKIYNPRTRKCIDELLISHIGAIPEQRSHKTYTKDALDVSYTKIEEISPGELNIFEAIIQIHNWIKKNNIDIGKCILSSWGSFDYWFLASMYYDIKMANSHKYEEIWNYRHIPYYWRHLDISSMARGYLTSITSASLTSSLERVCNYLGLKDQIEEAGLTHHSALDDATMCLYIYEELTSRMNKLGDIRTNE